MAKVYKTKQRDIILRAMQQTPKQHVTAEELAAGLRAQGEDVGLATVYRNLDKLVYENRVLKYTLPGGNCACYQYLPEDECVSPHFHLLCTQCGHIQHLECSTVDQMAVHFAAEHHFALDTNKTVFYGVCKACK